MYLGQVRRPCLRVIQEVAQPHATALAPLTLDASAPKHDAVCIAVEPQVAVRPDAIARARLLVQHTAHQASSLRVIRGATQPMGPHPQKDHARGSDTGGARSSAGPSH